MAGEPSLRAGWIPACGGMTVLKWRNDGQRENPYAIALDDNRISVDTNRPATHNAGYPVRAAALSPDGATLWDGAALCRARTPFLLPEVMLWQRFWASA